MDDFPQLANSLTEALRAAIHEFTSVWLFIQIGLILLAAAAAALAAALIRRRVTPVTFTLGWPSYLRLLTRLLLENVGVIIFVLLVAIIQAVMLSLTWPSRSYLVGVALSLATAWVVIALVARLIRNPFVYRLVAVSAWTLAALSILGLLSPTMTALDSVAVVVGSLRLTPLLVIKTSVLLLIALWIAAAIGDFLERQVHNPPTSRRRCRC
jgi:hypothetical protein